MTKPLPTDCIKWQKNNPGWKILNIVYAAVDLDDKLGNLFVVDNDFNFEKADAKILICNEIYTSVFDKKRC